MTWHPEWWLVALSVTVLVVFVVVGARQWHRARPQQRAGHGLRVVATALLVVVAMRPSGEHDVETPVVNAVDLVVMLDRTASMGALDHHGTRSRMEGAGEDLAEIVAGAAGARVSVLVFDDTARLLVPATTDVAHVLTTLRTVGWRPSAKAAGSDVSEGVGLARTTLESLAASRPGNRRVLVYAGDGEQTQRTDRASFGSLAELLDEAWVLGYGSAAGGAMPVAPDSATLVTRDGVEQRSVIDIANLRGIADELAGTLLHRTAPGELPQIARPARTQVREVVPGAEYYWVVSLTAVPFLLMLLAVGVRRWREVHDESGENDR